MDWKRSKERLIKDVGKLLVKAGALKFGTFTLTSGKLSSYYIDLRILPSLPGAFKLAINAYINIINNEIKKKGFDVIAGIPTAGLTYATVVAYELEKPLVYVRKEVKAHGLEKRIEGMINPGSNVLLLDDLITTGDSLISAAESIRAEGGVVDKAIVLIDRMEGGKERLKKNGIKLYSLVEIASLASFLYNMGVIGENEKLAIFSQLGLKK
jgi:orotate phosphoribosyltransferase